MSTPRLSGTCSCQWGALRFQADTLIRSHAWLGASTSRDALGFWGTADLGAVREDDGEVRAKPAASASLAGKVAGSLGGFIGLVAESPELRSTPSVWAGR